MGWRDRARDGMEREREIWREMGGSVIDASNWERLMNVLMKMKNDNNNSIRERRDIDYV